MSVIAVCSGKGSPGATFVAANLAAALSRANEEAVLLDLDPAGGDLCCSWDSTLAEGCIRSCGWRGPSPEPPGC